MRKILRSIWPVFLVAVVIVSAVMLTKGIADLTHVDPDIREMAEHTPKPTLLKTPTPTPTPTIITTNTPVATVQVPTATATLPYDPLNPMKYEDNNGNVIDFTIAQDATVSFAGITKNVHSMLYDPTLSTKNQLGSCEGGFNILAFNALEGESLSPVTYKTVLIGHSGSCANGNERPFEFLRYWLEGYYWKPDADMREARLQEARGMEVCFDQACFEISEIVYLDKKTLEDTQYIPGSYDQFFQEGTLSNKPEIFIYLCANGGIFSDDWFSAKYVIRLAVP